MGALTDALPERSSGPIRKFNFAAWSRENVTKSWLLTAWLIILAIVAVLMTVSAFTTDALTATVVILLWAVGLAMVIFGEVARKHNSLSNWLKSHLFPSITNSLLSLIILLVVIAAARSFLNYAVFDASFDPTRTTPDLRRDHGGATWGVVWGARKLWLTGTLAVEHLPRVTYALLLLLGLGFLTLITNISRVKRPLAPMRKPLRLLWLLSPIAVFILLSGSFSVSLKTALIAELTVAAVYALLVLAKVVSFNAKSAAVWLLVVPVMVLVFNFIDSTGIFPSIDPDTWGGLLFTLIVSIFSIIVSFPLGLALALGRRSEVRGIPTWLTWSVAGAIAAYGLATSTPEMLATARNNFERLLALWPLFVLLAAYLFQRMFKGNVVSAASTLYIETVRGVPLITVLFMAIVMAPLFFPAGIQIKNAWAVMLGFTLFTAAYLAENVRGGLQSIPTGQYEAADSLGLNGLQKMRFIILPQALRAVIPAIVGLFIGVFKDSSLVAVVGLLDLLGIVASIVSNPSWLGLRREMYVFIAIIYFVGSFAMSAYSRRLESRLGVGER